MPDILSLKTPHFELAVWTKDITKPQALLAKTYHQRSIQLPVSTVRFNPPLLIDVVAPQAELTLPEALFFENKLYEFEFLFNSAVNKSPAPTLIHRLSQVEESFHYKRDCLRGSINFGNDVGWFRLGVRYCVADREVTQYLSFEVLPTKMAMSTDLEGIHTAIDEIYPLWRFSFVQKTDQELAKSRKPHERFPLLWLAHFERLRADLEKAIKQICNAPHTRLLPFQHAFKAERLRGRLSSRLEERVTAHLGQGETRHHYQQSGQRLSVDTPENRFIKQVLIRCTQDITRFKKRMEQDRLSPDRGRISQSFITELECWKKPLEQLLNRPLFSEVGVFSGLASESLVLHQRAGYSSVYRIWQELKLYLDLFGHHAAISMKSVAELYEVWCLLEVRRLLFTLGFTEKSLQKASLKTAGFEKNLKEGMGAAFVLERADGVRIRLAHEPVFRQAKDPKFGKIYSWTTVQKPDIFLEATFPDGERVQWIFDAKYRLAEDGEGTDKAPDDALNQMHRYRDALIYVNQAKDGELEKHRPILGAYVLYPAWLDEGQSGNPYQEAIDAVGIGGFPLLPGQSNQWLRDFLVACFGEASVSYSIPESDKYFVEDSARIVPLGMQLSRYSDLTLASPLGPTAGRDKDYLQRFKAGQAGWYHIRLAATDNKAIARNIMQELRYCAVLVHHTGTERIITHLYEVKSVRLVRRCDLSVVQAGKVSYDQTEYWLLELGYARPLEQPVTMSGLRAFRFQLTNAADLLKAKSWEELPKRYCVLG